MITQTIDKTTEKDKLQFRIKSYCKEDPWYFLTNFIYTFDPHSTQKVRLFPSYSYLKFLVDEWQKNLFNVWAKSRQLLITNLAIGLHLWLANFHEGEYIIFQSTEEEKAGWGGRTHKDKEKGTDVVGDPEALLARTHFMYSRLDDYLQTPVSFSKTPPLMTFRHLVNDEIVPSIIRGVSSNPFVFNQLTATAVFADEISKQDNAEEAYQACLPILGDKGRYTCIGTAEGKNILYRLAYDIEI